jgi:ATP-dependent DNA helicase DinG
MERIFGRDGLLSRILEGFEYRPMQADMAREVESAISEGRPTIVEAGTGTGKTLAYLVPALLSGRKTLISTGTKTLQDQLLDHDIPVLREHLPAKFRAICLKGRRNYLCLHRFYRFVREPELVTSEEGRFSRELIEWVRQTRTGDRAELQWLPDDFGGWQAVTAGAEQCLGQKCPQVQECFLTRVRQEAAAAEMVIVNHHLFFADLAVRSGGYGQVIPRWEVAVFDEAHLLEEVAHHYFSVEVSSHRLQELLRDVAWELKLAGRRDATLVRLLETTGAVGAGLFEAFPATERRQRFRPEAIGGDLQRRWDDLRESLNELAAQLMRRQELSDALALCHRRTLELMEALRLVLDQGDPDRVYWYERKGKGTFLWASPVEVSPLLEELLFSEPRPYVFTSATLAVGSDLSFFKTRLGLPLDAPGLILEAPFAYRDQALVYLPRHLPTPDSPDFIPDEVAAILEETGGRAFILFTSHRNLRQVHARLAQRRKFALLVQGEQPKPVLLDRFREDVASVLLGTASFWQGVDMPGETLSCVIIDKLPFAPPDDPMVAARLERIAAKGGNPFWDYQIPSALLMLRQGLGRLIRRATDRGILAVMDSRLFTRSYGKVFLNSLPASLITLRREDIGAFLGGRPGEIARL